MQVLPRNGAIYTRLHNDYCGMARVQTDQMKATPTIYMPAIYDYNPHLIGCHWRHSTVDAKVWLARARELLSP